MTSHAIRPHPIGEASLQVGVLHIVRPLVPARGKVEIIGTVHQIVSPYPLNFRRSIGSEFARLWTIVPPKSRPNPIWYLLSGIMKTNEYSPISLLCRHVKVLLHCSKFGL